MDGAHDEVKILDGGRVVVRVHRVKIVFTDDMVCKKNKRSFDSCS